MSQLAGLSGSLILSCTCTRQVARCPANIANVVTAISLANASAPCWADAACIAQRGLIYGWPTTNGVGLQVLAEHANTLAVLPVKRWLDSEQQLLNTCRARVCKPDSGFVVGALDEGIAKMGFELQVSLQSKYWLAYSAAAVSRALQQHAVMHP